MNIQDAAYELRNNGKLASVKAERDELHGNTVEHICWMLEGIVKGYLQDNKGHRWLGYCQGWLVANEVVNLHDMKNLNHRS